MKVGFRVTDIGEIMDFKLIALDIDGTLVSFKTHSIPQSALDAIGKAREKGVKVFIATGYGVEGVLTDAFCNSIIRNEMIPHFRQNDYYGGVDAALKVIKPAMKGELNEEQYLGKDDGAEAILALLTPMSCPLLFTKAPPEFPGFMAASV